MLNIEKLEQECKEIERKIEKATFIELKKIIRDCNQKINGLNKRKSNLKNAQGAMRYVCSIVRIAPPGNYNGAFPADPRSTNSARSSSELIKVWFSRLFSA